MSWKNSRLLALMLLLSTFLLSVLLKSYVYAL
ncbi:hypothetical protein BC937DRAFT_86230 [Endogone sp. FLAS-F59071]|nr:hypothetical protein BC937DRAFT_86230 [Endogone sp. FLAS-F59071]|eukprot:RUS20174.1 hypothetical protein BC937DRAFT_86230 [Endogone sp. FLAS-F59071]